MEKISYRWTDRSVRLVKTVERMSAPAEIQRAAQDAVQHFVWATDCRRSANNPTCRTPGWGAKADKAHYHGKKCFKVAQTWVDTNRAAAQGAGDL